MVIRRLPRVVLVVPAAALALASGVLPAVAASPTGWRVQTTIAMKGKDVELIRVAADARNDAWATGFSVKGEGAAVSLVEHWDGSSWHRVVLPAGAVTEMRSVGDGLLAIGASSPRNVWAFGVLGEWLRWNGTRWTFGRLPRSRLTVRVDSALVLGPRNVWAFGLRLRSDGAMQYAAHFNGAKWVTASLPDAHVIVDASAVSARDIWVLSGFSPIEGGEPGSLAHWSGGKWRSVPVPKALGDLRSIVALSDSDVWVGSAVASGRKGGTEAVGHWNGHRWKVTPMPVSAGAHGFLEIAIMAPDGTGGLWAEAGSSFEAVTSRLWHYSHGHWRQSSLRPLHGSPLQSVAYVPRSRSVWGVGSINSAGMIALAGPLPRTA